jgi:Ca-activated chloride channel homolog
VPGSLRAVIVAVALVAAGGAAWTGYSRLGGSGCTGQVRLTVAAAPEIARAIETTAEQWVAGGAQVGGRCVAVDTTAMSPVDVAAAVAGRLGISLTGVGRTTGGVAVPEVWVPDSTTWLMRLQTAAAGLVPVSGPSLARSTVVLAMPEPAAKRLGWPGKRPSYRDMLDAITTDTELHPGIVDPSRDAAGLAGVLALSRAASTAGDPAKVTAAVLKSLALGNSTVPQDLLNKFPRQPDRTSLLSAKVTLAPLPEQAVIAYNAGRPPVRVAALYLDPEPPPLDYPYVALPGLDSAQAAAAELLQALLAGSAFRDMLAANGLRAPDGTAGAGFAAPRGAPSDVTPSPSASGSAGGSGSGGDSAGVPDAGTVQRALRTWSAVTSRS